MVVFPQLLREVLVIVVPRLSAALVGCVCGLRSSVSFRIQFNSGTFFNRSILTHNPQSTTAPTKTCRVMATTSLPSLFDDSVQRLNAFVLSEALLVEDPKLKGLLYAAGMKLMNWKSDIKDEEKATLSKLEGISPQIADIVRGRLVSLSGAIQAVESLHSREISAASEEAE
jgi:hypothetical protein